MIRGRVGAAGLLVLAAAIVPAAALRTARAQEPSFSLSWEAPGECPSESYVRGAVEQLLGGGPPPPAHVSARAIVEHGAPDHWSVRLTTVRDGATGERVVQSQSCQSLADATALIVALTIDPERVAARAPTSAASPSAASASPAASAAPLPSASTPLPAPAPPATSAAPAPTTPAPRPAPPPSPSAREEPPAPGTVSRPTLVALFATAGGDVGTLPRAAFSINAGAALTLGALRLEGYGTYLPAQATYAATEQSLGTNLHLLAGGLRGCFLPLRGALEAGGCAGMELGDLHGQGFGVSTPYQKFTSSDAGAVWLATTLDGRVSWRITRSFALVLDVGAVVPWWRPPFVIDNLQGAALHQAGLVEGRAAIGPEVRF